MTGETIERVAKALDATRHLAIGASLTNKAHMAVWNVRTSECVADGFVDDKAASDGLRAYRARAAIEATNSPEADAEQRVIREAMSFDSCMAEFEGEMSACGEHLDGLFTACDALRKVRNAALATP